MAGIKEHVRRLTASHATAFSAAATLAVFVLVDRSANQIAQFPTARYNDSSLFLAGARSNIVLIVLIIGLLVAIDPRRLFALRWEDIGSPLRRLAVVLIVVLLWRRLMAPYDYLHGEWHLVDRALLAACGLAALARPIALLPFVFLTRVLVAPVTGLVFAPGDNIEILPVMMLMAIVAGALLATSTTWYRSESVVSVMLAAVGAQFFVPGWSKLRSAWVVNNDLSNLPLNGHAQGFLREETAELATRFSDAIDAVEPGLLALTLALELVALIVVFRGTLARLWLMALVGFHIATFLALGFVFFEFVIVELALVALLASPVGRQWSRTVFVGIAPVVTALAVLFGSVIFDPPTLAWYDTNVVQRIDIDGVDRRGEVWVLEPSHFAPFNDTFAFSAVELDASAAIVHGYGSAGRGRFDDLQKIANIVDLRTFESSLDVACDSESIGTYQRILRAFLVETENRGRLRELLSPPAHFQVSRPGPVYDFSEPLVSLTVRRVTILRVGDDEFARTEPVDWQTQARC